MQAILQVIQQIEVFRGLSAAQRLQLAEITERQDYTEGAVIVEQDTPGDTLYIIGTGQVEVLQSGGSGVSATTVFLGEGQIFGEVAFLDQGMRTATVIAAEDSTTVYSIQRDRFEALCKADTALGYQIMRNLALDLAFKLRHQNLDTLDQPGGADE
jgi:CRP/FNR family cyclic AMP-dependent transcriptional regulator